MLSSVAIKHGCPQLCEHIIPAHLLLAFIVFLSNIVQHLS